MRPPVGMLAVLVVLGAIPSACARRPPAASLPLTARPAAGSPAPPSIDAFEASVKPILARSCSPCHAPGGRMYDRLPFDVADVVRANKEAIVKRLKTPEDRDAIERWASRLQAPKR